MSAVGGKRKDLAWLLERGERARYEDAEQITSRFVTVTSWLTTHAGDGFDFDDAFALENALVAESALEQKMVVSRAETGAPERLVFASKLIRQACQHSAQYPTITPVAVTTAIARLGKETTFGSHPPYATVEVFADWRSLDADEMARLSDLVWNRRKSITRSLVY